jgi:hypothetical protein
MSDLTDFISGADEPRPVTLAFTADGVPFTVNLQADTDPSTYWAEAASAIVNVNADSIVSVSLHYELGQVSLFAADGTERVIEVILT